MALRSDPTQTTRIRRGFEAEIRRRFDSLRSEVTGLIDRDDALGLRPETTLLSNARGIWRFRTNDDKLEEFSKWLDKQIKDKVLSVPADARGSKAWTSKWVESAYRKGNLRAFLDARKKPVKGSKDFLTGEQAQFLRTAFGQPEQMQKVRLLATRTFEQLKGVTAKMAADMNRVLSEGIANGQNPKVVAKALVKQVGLSKNRALMIARTEIIHAHAEGQLDSFVDLGVEEVGVFAEWSTAGDEKVCASCAALEGKVFSIEEARGLIPRHPNCRCAWIPALDVKKTIARKKMLAAVKKSIGVIKSGKKKGKLRPTTWAGQRLVKKGAKR